MSTTDILEGDEQLIKSLSFYTLAVAFLVGLLGASVAILIKQQLSTSREPLRLPMAMNSDQEYQYYSEYGSRLDIGSKFPEEKFYTQSGDSASFHELFTTRMTVLLLWSPDCQSCADQAALWDHVMEASLASSVDEVVCLPRVYLDSSLNWQDFVNGKRTVFFNDDRFRTLYHLINMPTIIAVDNQEFIAAIQYAYSPYFTQALIEAVTDYEVGPCIPTLRAKSSQQGS